ncbi:MAG: ABC transporter ATP-binding protein [Tissierellaceae bacterium]
MLEIKGLNKSFGSNLVLKDINLDIEGNKIYGLLGRNGAGKTTLLNLISSQLIRNSGDIKYQGEEIFENSKAIEDMCLVKPLPESSKDKKVRDIFTMARLMYKNWDESYKEQLISEFNLNTNKRLQKLSAGNKTIVGLIIGLASRAKLTIFDEPTLGLDAAMRYMFYNSLLKDYETNPRTVIISTHLIDELANLFEEVIILNSNMITLKDEVSNLRERSYFLSGNGDIVNEIVKNRKILYREELGSTMIVGIYDNLSENEKREIRSRNIEISTIPLQKLFVFLTEGTLGEVM